jgi:glycosyltransferase involved in cell wall biosynthesis
MPDKRPFGISAFLRCKNEEEYIVASILSSYRIFDEIVVVLNNSTDNTRPLVEDLMTDHPKIKLLTWDYECAPAGPGYIEAVRRDPTRSLARYYNWCLEQTTYSHVCKWDGDMVAIPPFEEVRGLLASNDMIAIDGWDPLGKPTVNYEGRIFKYDPAHTKYADWDLYEILLHEYGSGARVEQKCYVHMKLVKREWVHRDWVNPNDFATTPYPPSGSGSIGRPAAPSLLQRVVGRVRRGIR